MNFMTLLLISIGLAMDAFAVSLTEGIVLRKLYIKNILRVAIIFGIFQGIMPLIGWNIGNLFYNAFEKYGSFIAFGLLIFVGGKMLLEAREFSENEEEEKPTTNIFILGIATSIDALAVGFSFSLLPGINIYFAISIIGVVTFLLSSLGVYLGSKVGQLLGSKAEYLGGIILILIGIDVLFQ